MRILSERQRSLPFYQSLPSFTQEWDMIASILEANREIEQRVWEDLTANAKGGRKKSTGAEGMPAEQVLRFAIVKMKERLSYRRLQARVADSICLRGFCLVGQEEVPVFTTLQTNIKRIRPQTWKAVNELVIGYAYSQGAEDGQRVRIDTTGVKTDIHHPTDSHQLWDSVRVLARILQRVETDVVRLRGAFHDHRRAAKRLFYRIHNTRGQDKKKPLYKRASSSEFVGHLRLRKVPKCVK
jgi:IS5 family transposase